MDPRSKFVSVTRGGFTNRIMPAFQEVSVVAMPFSSRPRAISPTDWQHIGQAGTSKAAFTFSSLAISRTAGIVSSTTCVTLGW